MRTVLMVLFDEVQSLDVTGPLEVFTGANTWRTHHGDGPGYAIRTASLGGRMIRTSSGLRIAPGAGLPDVPRPDIIVVPGGPGQNSQMQDGPLHEWLRAADQASVWTTSVCTGSLILAAAGLLTGRRATTHWLALDELGRLGATPVGERVVFDGKFVTAAGVSSGIDMALSLAGQLAGDEVAQAIQLMIEYDPQPPYDSGSPDRAPAEVVRRLRARSRRG
jgi:transcriptional regulator GlxA family with amidase domain